MCHCPLANCTNLVHSKAGALLVKILPKLYPESVLVNLLRSPGIDSQPSGINFFHRNRFLGSLNVYKYGL